MRALIAVAVVLPLLCGCATKAEPQIRTVEVKVPVTRPCVAPDVPPPPRYADGDLNSATPPDQRYLKTATANQERKARLARIEPVIAACR